MPVNDELTPMEASYIATNVYFTLKDWIQGTPTAGVETRANVHNRVLGPGTAGTSDPKQPNPTLAGTALGGSRLGQVFRGTTGLNTESGFGYVLQLKQNSRRHVVIATRGTRPELGAPDLVTDLRAAMTGFGSYGPVHKGFKGTFDSVCRQLAGSERVVMDADVVHCVGHSLGGAVATLVAAHYKSRGKAVKLYTFGSPRVGALGSPAVYDALPRFALRIARVAERADAERLQALMRELPEELPPLTGRLTEADGARWRELLGAGCAPLQALIAEVRRLDPPI